MAARISRRALAEYSATRLAKGAPVAEVVTELAAYLISTGREREADLMARAIEDHLTSHGIVIARVTTARPLTDDMRAAVRKTVAAERLEIDEIIDPSVIGGIRIETPDAAFDGTIKRKLTALMQAKV